MEDLRNIEMNHFVVSSLNSQESPIVEQLVNHASVVVSDVDYTLFPFEKGHVNGHKRWSKYLISIFHIKLIIYLDLFLRVSVNH